MIYRNGIPPTWYGQMLYLLRVRSAWVAALFIVACALFVGLMAVCIFPVTERLAAPIVCRPGYVRTAVVVESSTNADGTTTRGDLYCVDRDGVPARAHWAGPPLVLGLALAVPGLLVELRARRRERTRRPP